MYDLIQQRVSSDLEDVDVENDAILGSNNIPRRLRIRGRSIPTRKDPEQGPSQQKGFNWEIERLRRYFAGLRMRGDEVLDGDLQTLAGCPFFLLLNKYIQVYGPVFNLSFGPKSFLIVSDPVMARHVLRQTSPEKNCKGMLAEILDPIMGKGLIPANPATWKVRHQAIVPLFHKRWLNWMITIFTERAEILANGLQPKSTKGQVIDMEERFCSVKLDSIGKAVFNHDFGSVTGESPIIKAVQTESNYSFL